VGKGALRAVPTIFSDRVVVVARFVCPPYDPSSSRNGFAVIAGGTSPCEPRRMTEPVAILRDARKSALLRMTAEIAATPHSYSPLVHHGK